MAEVAVICRAPNVLNFIKRFNSVSQWTATNILREIKLKKRGRLMAKFISIALVRAHLHLVLVASLLTVPCRNATA
jgi:hypothetical protein